MEIKTIPQQIGVIFPSGRLDRDTTFGLQEAVERLLTQKFPHIVISLGHVQALLSDGIRQLVVLQNLAVEGNADLHITDLSREAKYTLQITNLLDWLKYAPTLEATLSQLGFSVAMLTTADAETSAEILVESDEIGAENLSARTSETASPQTTAASHPAETAAPTKTNVGVPESVLDPQKRRGLYGEISRASARSVEQSKASSLFRVEPKAAPTVLTEDEIRRIIKAHMPGRVCLKICEIALTKSQDLINYKDDIEARLINEYKADDIAREMKRLVVRGTLTSVGGGMYNFGVSVEIRKKIDQVLAALKDKNLRTTVIKLLISMEKV